ncbi:MAG: leucine-rich repeat domain-containing protein, partial [Candidatus Sigynarchaeota archaeon]
PSMTQKTYFHQSFLMNHFSFMHCTLFIFSLLSLIIYLVYQNRVMMHEGSPIVLFFAENNWFLVVMMSLGMYSIIVFSIQLHFKIDFKKKKIRGWLSFIFLPIYVIQSDLRSIIDLWIQFQKKKTKIILGRGYWTIKIDYFKFTFFIKTRQQSCWRRVFSYIPIKDNYAHDQLIQLLIDMLPAPECIQNFNLFHRYPHIDICSNDFYWRKYYKFELGPHDDLNHSSFSHSKKDYCFLENGQYIVVNKNLNKMACILDQKIYQQELANKKGAVNIQSIVLWKDDIEEIQKLDVFHDIIELDLSRNKIRENKNLEHYPKLRKLDLSHNNITRIENLESLKDLEELWLSSNNIERIEGLDKLLHLRRLYLSCNHISRIENLEALKNLEVLCLDRNEITKIEKLDALENLVELNLWHNQIKVVENLEALLHLKKVHLQGNPLDIGEIWHPMSWGDKNKTDAEIKRQHSLKRIEDILSKMRESPDKGRKKDS